MKSVLMVCLGNICRSPIAEGVLRDLAEKKNSEVSVDSCGTGGWHAGENPDRWAVQTLKNKDIDISQLRARKFIEADFDKFDLILTMDRSNFNDIMLLAKNDAQRAKVKMALPKGDVPDPYYGTLMDFEVVYDLLVPALEKHLSDLVG